jgi:hypothetical protein
VLTTWQEERAVLRVLDHYGDLLDRRDWRRLDELFIPKASAEWLLATHRWHHTRAEIVASIRGAFDEFGPTHHHFGNYLADVDGGRATASCRVCNYHALIAEHANQYRQVYGAYQIRAVKLEGAWRIEHMRPEAFDTVYGLRDQRPANPRRPLNPAA